MKIEGSVVFITGGGSGLGLDAARTLQARGAKLSIVDYSEENLASAKKLLGEKDVLYAKVDVSRESECKEAVEQTFKHFGAIHVCLNSAGIVDVLSLMVTRDSVIDFETFRHMMEINLFGTVYCAAFCAFYMSKNKADERGVIINIASVAAYEAAKGMVSYGASKGAVAGIALPIARDLGKFGI